MPRSLLQTQFETQKYAEYLLKKEKVGEVKHAMLLQNLWGLHDFKLEIADSCIHEHLKFA